LVDEGADAGGEAAGCVVTTVCFATDVTVTIDGRGAILEGETKGGAGCEEGRVNPGPVPVAPTEDDVAEPSGGTVKFNVAKLNTKVESWNTNPVVSTPLWLVTAPSAVPNWVKFSALTNVRTVLVRSRESVARRV
jgi:hypothetical protein